MRHEIGRGVLAWPAPERRTDRYGAVLLSTSPTTPSTRCWTSSQSPGSAAA
ncbi:hypothetical protein [Nocardia jiangsuensis]|uniref:Uncharacterized protein n=1 Tax=Nocardia jiangsuensis TaxID=1691563 RepID=A0ABV8DTX7_9NOCA